MECLCPTCGQHLPEQGFQFDPESGIVVANGSFVQLPRREAQILEVLLEKAGRVITRESLFAAVYGRLDGPEYEEVIESHVSKLRKKVATLGIAILSERFKGYWLKIGAVQ